MKPKKPKLTDEQLMGVFLNEVEFRLAWKIRTALKNNDDLEELRESCTNLTNLGKERGVKTDAESKAGLDSGELNSFFLKKPINSKKSHEYWND
jgi:hypothetical protein